MSTSRADGDAAGPARDAVGNCFTWLQGVMNTTQNPPICNYEGSRYRADFWEGRGREYEDAAERIALSRLLPTSGRRLVEIGAGYGRLADLYGGYERVFLLDYARSQLREAQRLSGSDPHFTYVLADLYNLPFNDRTIDVAVTVRVLHHVADIPAAFSEIHRILARQGTYVLEYANKRNLKAVLRHLARRQTDNPFSQEPYEFVELNFNFHPAYMDGHLHRAGFADGKELAVSHFRLPLLKRLVPPALLARLDGLLQEPAARWRLTPSIFVRATAEKPDARTETVSLWRCPRCHASDLREEDDVLVCRCGAHWPVEEGIYILKDDDNSSQNVTSSE